MHGQKIYILIHIISLILVTFFMYRGYGKKDQQGKRTTEKYQRHNTSIWNIEPDFALDILCLLNVLTGDTFYVKYFENDFQHLKNSLLRKQKKPLPALMTK